MKKYTASGCSDNPPSDQPGPVAAPGQVGIYRPPPGLHLLRSRGPLLLRRSFCSTRFEHRSYVSGGGGHHASRAQVPLSMPGAIIRTAERLNTGQQHAAGTIASPPCSTACSRTSPPTRRNAVHRFELARSRPFRQGFSPPHGIYKSDRQHTVGRYAGMYGCFSSDWDGSHRRKQPCIIRFLFP